MRSFFLFFILKSKNRQGLLNLVFAGLIISSMSLVVLQGVMGGLQTNLKQRSKKIIGDYVVYLNLSGPKVNETISALKATGYKFRVENIHEGLLQFNGATIPVTLHGLYQNTQDFEVNNGPVFPYEILSMLAARPGNDVEFFSPSYVDSFFSDVPRSFSLNVNSVISTQVPEIDSSHIWLKASLLNNFMRQVYANRIVLFTSDSKIEVLNTLKRIYPGLPSDSVKSWEDLHTSLVWALTLEKIMMVFLFCGMCFLVCLSISSAVLVFIKKVNKDLTALWVLGSSKKEIYLTSKSTLVKICIGSILFGVLLGSLLLVILDNYSGEIMPDVFVERKIPVRFNFSMYVIAICIPSFLSIIFTYLGLNEFKQETDYLKNVRSIGQV